MGPRFTVIVACGCVQALDLDFAQVIAFPDGKALNVLRTSMRMHRNSSHSFELYKSAHTSLTQRKHPRTPVCIHTGRGRALTLESTRERLIPAR